MVLIEGLGKSQGKVVHNALALLTYNKAEDKLSFRSHSQNGSSGEFAGADGGSFVLVSKPECALYHWD